MFLFVIPYLRAPKYGIRRSKVRNQEGQSTESENADDRGLSVHLDISKERVLGFCNGGIVYAFSSAKQIKLGVWFIGV